MTKASRMPLAALHTFGFKHYCNDVITITDTQAASAFCCEYRDVNRYILGEGSNTVFVEDFDGVVGLIEINGIEVTELPYDYRIVAGAGEKWADLVFWTVSKGMPGLENLAAIPGTVGAAPIQNIGAYGAEVADFIESVTILEIKTGKVKALSNHECEFAYRDSVFKRELSGDVIILSVNFLLKKAWTPNLSYGDLCMLDSPSPKTLLQHIIETRNAKLPDVAKCGNAGSFFKNPYVSLDKLKQLQVEWPTIPSFSIDAQRVKLPAGWLIEQLGLKGLEHNGIQVYPNQALVLTNIGSSRGADLLAFARKIRVKVYETFGVWLENEVRLVSRNGEIAL